MASATKDRQEPDVLEQSAEFDNPSTDDTGLEETSGSVRHQSSRRPTSRASRDSGFPSGADALSRYHMIMRLGRGGMARVYLARRRTGLSKLLVLKVLEPELSQDASARHSFQQEAKLSALMSHPNVVQVHEVFEAEGTPVMVMEYLEGWSLREVLKVTARKLPLSLNLMIMGQVLNALHYVHEMTDLKGDPLGAVHRDVSPNNIMILPSGFVKVLDFGVAKAALEGSGATETGIIKGKLRYMAPEQLMAGALDRRVDIFAAGVILWEMLARRRMWAKVPEAQVIGALAHGEIPELPDDVDAPEALLEAIRRATAADPDGRFDTAHDFAKALESTAAELAPQPSPSEITAHLGEQLEGIIRERRALIQTAVREASSSATTNLDDLPMIEPSVHTDSGGVNITGHSEALTTAASGLSTSTSGTRVASTGTSKEWRIAALVSAALLIGAIVAFTQFDHRESPALPTSEAESLPLKVQVTAYPTNATIYLNDTELPANPAEFSPPNGTWHLKVVAAGHTTLEKTYDGSEQGPIALHLQPLPLGSASGRPAATAAPDTAETTSAAPSPKPAARQVWRPRRAPTQEPEQPTSPQANSQQPKPERSNCSPPYYYDEDGTKIFRQECF